MVGEGDRRGGGCLHAAADLRVACHLGDQMGGRPGGRMGATMEEDLQPMGEEHRARQMEAHRVLGLRGDHQGAYRPEDRMGGLLEDLRDGRPEDPLGAIRGSTTTTKGS